MKLNQTFILLPCRGEAASDFVLVTELPKAHTSHSASNPAPPNFSMTLMYVLKAVKAGRMLPLLEAMTCKDGIRTPGTNYGE